MPTSSANLSHLETFVKQATPASSALRTKFTGANAEMSAFLAAPNDYPLQNGAGIMAEVGTFCTNNETDDQFVDTVRQAFIKADATSGELIDDAKITAALTAAGIGANPRSAITVDSPVFIGKPLMSGWSDDPVCTATGHFLEIETDLAMPESLEILGWTRTYSSRFLRPSATGRGWACWADVRLTAVNEIEVEYRGPDGQRGSYVVDGAGYGPNPDVGATLAACDGGYEMDWPWESRFPGERWRFDGRGRLVEVVTRLGRVVRFEHDAEHMVSVRDQGGRTLQLRWEGDRIREVRSSDGRTVEYEYRGDDLAAVRRALGDRRYDTDGDGRIVGILDGDGVQLIENTYDADGRVLTQRSPEGRLTTYRYLAPNTVVVSDEQGGPTTLYRHDREGRLASLQVGDRFRLVRQFDDHGNPVLTRDADGGVTVRTFDLAGNCVLETRPDGASWAWTYDGLHRVSRATDPSGAVYDYHYEAAGRQPVRIEGPLGFRMDFRYRDGQMVQVTDADGVTASIEYDDDGCMVATVDALGRRTEFAVHASGTEARTTLPTGATLVLERDDAGRIQRVEAPGRVPVSVSTTAEGRLSRLTDDRGSTSELEWSPAGLLAGYVDAAGARTNFGYDVFGNQVRRSGPDGEWLFAYDAMANVVERIDPVGGRWVQEWTPGGDLLALVDPTGRRVQFGLDALGRATEVTAPSGRVLRLGFDAFGNIDESQLGTDARVRIERDVLGRPVEVAVDETPLLRLAYTPAGRVSVVAHHDGSIWTYTYDAAGHLASVVGPDGVETYQRDSLGRPAVVDRNGRSTTLTWAECGEIATYEEDGQRWSFAWDPATGNLAELRWPDGSSERRAYDRAGRLGNITNRAGGTTTVSWDEAGRVAGLTDPKGAPWTCDYDPLGFPAGASDPLGRRSSLERDGAGNLVGLRFEGHDDVAFALDAATRLRGVDVGGERRWTVELDDEHRTRRSTESGGPSVVEAWDGEGRLAERIVDGESSRWDHERDAVTVMPADGAAYREELDVFGRVVAIDHPVAGRVELERDLEGRLVTARGAGLERRWTYEGVWLVAYDEARGGETKHTTFERDGLGRVVAEHTEAGTTRYEYDVAGQLTSTSTPDGTWHWTYDLCGRLVEETGPAGRRQFTYDAADQLIGMDGPDGTTRYEYDARGQRVAEVGPSRSRRYRWDPLGRLAGIDTTDEAGVHSTDLRVSLDGDLLDVDGTALRWSPAGPLGARLASIGSTTVLWADAAPIALVDDDAVEWLSADWRGSIGRSPSPWGSAEGTPNPMGLGYLGELELGDGLVWLRSRVYDPVTHAFLSRDPWSGPAGTPGGLTNLYQYAANDPIGMRDPLGLRPLTVEEANKQIAGYRDGHWKQALVIAGCVVVGGIVVAATGGAGLALIGAGIGMGVSAGVQYATTGKIDPWQVAMAGATGFAGGAVGGALFSSGGVAASAGRTGLWSAKQGLAYAAISRGGTSALGKSAAWALDGGTSGATSNTLDQLGNTGTVDPTALAESAALGAGANLPAKYAGNLYKASRAAGQARVETAYADAAAKPLRQRINPLSSNFRVPFEKTVTKVQRWGYETHTNITKKTLESTSSNAIKGGVKITTADGQQVPASVTTSPNGVTWVTPAG